MAIDTTDDVNVETIEDTDQDTAETGYTGRLHYVTHVLTIDGGTGYPDRHELSDEEYQLYLLHPEKLFKQKAGVSIDTYRAWARTQGHLECCALNARGGRCGKWFGKPVNPRDWPPATGTSGLCPRHAKLAASQKAST